MDQDLLYHSAFSGHCGVYRVVNMYLTQLVLCTPTLYAMQLLSCSKFSAVLHQWACAFWQLFGKSHANTGHVHRRWSCPAPRWSCLVLVMLGTGHAQQWSCALTLVMPDTGLAALVMPATGHS